MAKLPLDTVKIDQSFIAQLHPGGGSGVEVVRAILSLASSLRMKVVAEGVETAEQLDQLVQLGCSVAQGYLFGAPVPAEEAAAHLNTVSPVVLPKAKAKRGRPPRKKA